MDESNKAGLIAAVLIVGLLIIIIVSMAKGQKEVPDDRPHPTHTTSISR